MADRRRDVPSDRRCRSGCARQKALAGQVGRSSRCCRGSGRARACHRGRREVHVICRPPRVVAPFLVALVAVLGSPGVDGRLALDRRLPPDLAADYRPPGARAPISMSSSMKEPGSSVVIGTAWHGHAATRPFRRTPVPAVDRGRSPVTTVEEFQTGACGWLAATAAPHRGLRRDRPPDGSTRAWPGRGASPTVRRIHWPTDVGGRVSRLTQRWMLECAPRAPRRC
jgi:hypothetical protein